MMKCFTKDPEKFAFDSNAAYAMEKAILNGSDDLVTKLIVKLLDKDCDIVKLCTDSYATHVIQVIVKHECRDSNTHRVLIADKLKHNFAEVATDKRGMFVTNGLLKKLNKTQIEVTMKSVLFDKRQMKKLLQCSKGRSFVSSLKKILNIQHSVFIKD